MTSENEKKSSSLSVNQKIMIGGFAAVILVIIVVGVVILTQKKDNSTPLPAGTNFVVDESNLETIQNQMKELVEDGMYEMSMSTNWVFPDGESAASDFYLANPSSNHYPITFEILLNGEEVIYSSSLIPVGKQLGELKLDKDLEAGSYDAVCMYHLWKEDGTENSTFGVNIRISVEK